MKWLRLLVGLYCALCLILAPNSVYAQYSSDSYKVEEVQFSNGGELEASSDNYNVQLSTGNLASGTTSSSGYQAYSGFITPNEEFLEVLVTPANIDLGLLNTSTTSTGTSTFAVRSYLSSTYVVVLMSQPPTSEGGSVLDAMAQAGAPVAGTEQFGINLSTNTLPVNFGANPSPFPGSDFAYGEAAPGYDTANQFKFNTTDIIARSITSGWGRTDYTVSYVANMSTITPAGLYTYVQNIVVTATF